MASQIPHRVGDVVEMTAQRQKDELNVNVERADVDTDSNEPLQEFKSTSDDAANMQRMGKQQELVRHFRVLSMASFTAVATCAWELTIFQVTAALTNGGRPTLVYAVIWNFVGFVPIYLSMAEMASMAPIAGAQYHWVSEFAPESLQRGLSYLTGWSSTMAWQAGNAQGVFLAGTIVQILMSLHDSSYPFTQWHTTLLAMAAIVVSYCANVYGARILHLWQNAVFVLHILVYFAFIIPIWVNAPRATSRQVWTEFEFSGGWPSHALAVLIGQQTGIFSQIGVDTAAHMSEEVRDASSAVPKSMLSIWVINFCLTFPSFLTIAYHVPVIEEALAEPALYPVIYVLRQSMNNNWLTVLLTFILFLIMCCTITYLAAVTRDIWAFARDQGFPFSNWIAAVDKRRRVPRNAVLLTSIVATCLSLIYIGSAIAFFAMTSLITVALLQCYGFSIGCLLWRRIMYPETLPPAKFSLGRLGIPINLAAVCYALWAFFWAFWPTYSPVNAANFNWAAVLFIATLIGAGIHFVFVAHRKYFGPVANVEGRNVEPQWTGHGSHI